jgi:hypothetical protein
MCQQLGLSGRLTRNRILIARGWQNGGLDLSRVVDMGRVLPLPCLVTPVFGASTRHVLPVGPQLWGGQVIRSPGRDWSCNICVLSPAGYQLLRAVQAWQPARSSPEPVAMPLLEHVHFRRLLTGHDWKTGCPRHRISCRPVADGRDQRGIFYAFQATLSGGV